jgi:hypothetical protein
MATHASEDLALAARQIGAAARDIGLAPTSQALSARVA